MTEQVTHRIVRRTITVRCTPERAFRTFTEEIDAWWPLATHSLGGDRARRAVLEARTGGRLYEVWDDGTERGWGTVVAWEPPGRVAVAWTVHSEANVQTEWEARFAPDGAGGTRVELEHRGWEQLGDRAGETSASYASDEGWAQVLGAFAERAAAA